MKRDIPRKSLLTIEEVAKRLNITRRAIDQHRKSKTWPIPVYRIGGKVQMYDVDVDDYIQSCRES